MNDAGARRVLGRVMTPVARGLLRLGVTPNAVTVAGTIISVAAALWFFPRGDMLVGALVLAVVVFSDSLDGNMARISGKVSTFGKFLDSTLDRLSDAAIFGGIALYYFGTGDSLMTASLALVCLVLAFLISYARARAEGVGLVGKAGFAERAMRLVIVLALALLVGCGLPREVMTYGLAVLALLCAITFIQRVAAVYREAREAGA